MINRKQSINRRKFFQDSGRVLGAGALFGRQEALEASGAVPSVAITAKDAKNAREAELRMCTNLGTVKNIWILTAPNASFQERFASKELARGLRSLGLAQEVRQASIQGAEPGQSDLVFDLAVRKEGFSDPEAYEIVHASSGERPARVRLVGANPQAVLYSVFDFLERQGTFFGLDGPVYPLDANKAIVLPPAGASWKAQPQFKVRGLLPWPDFLNCVTVYNRTDWRAYLEAMVRMRFNTLGVHVYSSANEWTESFLSFEYGPTGHWAFTDTTATNRWGYLPERTARFGMGAADFYAGEVFGSKATTHARSCWEDQKFAQKLWGEAFSYAQQLGIRTGVGFEPYSIPEEIVRAVPPEALFVNPHPKLPAPKIDPESMAAKNILEARLARLLEAYPDVDYVWLWEDEASNWASRDARVPLSVTPFQQAYDFLRRHAPRKRMVLSGWGGVVRHFAYFHEHLAEDVIFSALNDSVGWDPVSEEFSKLGSRERWPIPWLEDDPAMWLPQLHVYRLKRDMDLASKYGCQGIFGIHWRTRIMNGNAGFLEHYAWDQSLSPQKYYETFAASLCRPERTPEVARTLNSADCDRLLLSSWDGKIVDGHHQIHEYSGDYDQAFQYWNGYEPSEAIKESQAKVAQELRKISNESSGPAEYERLNYWTRLVEFLGPYSESWSLAFQLYGVLEKAGALKKAGKLDEAKALIQAQGLPMWLKLAPEVRKAILDYQDVPSTRGDLGTIASIHNKYERLALFRLPASMKEYLRGLPAEVEAVAQEALKPDAQARIRIFIPTRPTVLARNERLQISAVAVGGELDRAPELLTRTSPGGRWSGAPMVHAGRRTFVAGLTSQGVQGSFLDYYVRVLLGSSAGKKESFDPVDAPKRFYTLTLV